MCLIKLHPIVHFDVKRLLDNENFRSVNEKKTFDQSSLETLSCLMFILTMYPDECKTKSISMALFVGILHRKINPK